ncbi:hypothetical protein AX16_005847 [Volvariella volvacea WC 439]|nr:hypothetical protein AX16_005847 [Volvariella volvacea WC 439]
MPNLRALELYKALPSQTSPLFDHSPRIFRSRLCSLNIKDHALNCAFFLEHTSFEIIPSSLQISCLPSSGQSCSILQPSIAGVYDFNNQSRSFVQSLQLSDSESPWGDGGHYTVMANICNPGQTTSSLILQWHYLDFSRPSIHTLMQLLPLSRCRKLTFLSSFSNEEWDSCIKHLPRFEEMALLGRRISSESRETLLRILARVDSDELISAGSVQEAAPTSSPYEMALPALRSLDRISKAEILAGARASRMYLRRGSEPVAVWSVLLLDQCWIRRGIGNIHFTSLGKALLRRD